MKIAKSIELRDRLIVRVDDALYWTQQAKENHMQLHKRLTDIFASESACKNMPYWVRAYVDGYIAAKREPLKRSMIYGVWLDNSFYDATDKTSARYVENRGMTWKEFGEITTNPNAMVGHWWKDDVTKPWSSNLSPNS